MEGAEVPPAPGGGGEEAEEDDELVLTDPADPGKPGFQRWVDALSSRDATMPSNQCLGRWSRYEALVEVLVARGKKIQNLGFSRGSERLLRPEEALLLVDEGAMVLVDVAANAAAASSAAVAASATEGAPASGPDAASGVGSSANPALGDSLPFDDGSGKVWRVMPFHKAYALLLGQLDLPTYTVYSQLVNIGFMAYRHKPLSATVDATAISAAGGVAAVSRPLITGDDQPPPAPPGTPIYTPPAVAGAHALWTGTRAVSVTELDDVAPPASASTTAAGGSGGVASLVWTPEGLLAPEAELVPVFDVYTRDGLTSFKPSAPGAPDFYCLVAK